MKKILSIMLMFLGIFIIGFASSGIIKGSFADEDVDLIINYQEDSSLPAIFNSENGMLYPGKSASGSMKIKNGLKNDINFDKFGMEVEVYKMDENKKKVFSKDENLRKEFLENMELTIEYNDLVKKVLKGTVYSGDLKDFEKNGSTGKINNMDPGEILNLKYTIKMKESATADIAGINSSINFTFNLKEEDTSTGGSGSGGGNNRDKDDSKTSSSDEIIIEDEETPLGNGSNINYMILGEMKLFIGYEDSEYKMDRYINNAELITVLVRAINYTKGKELILKAEENEAWYEPYVNQAYEYGLIENNYLNNPEAIAKKEYLVKLVIKTFNSYDLVSEELNFLKLNTIINALQKQQDNIIDTTFVKRSDMARLICELFPEALFPNELKVDDKNE